MLEIRKRERAATVPLLDPDTVRATDQRVPCLKCTSVGPHASIVLLRDYVIRNGKVVGVPSGERVCCQRCGWIFTITPSGSFQQAASALPFTPQPQGQPEPAPNGMAEERPQPQPYRPHYPVPRERPRP